MPDTSDIRIPSFTAPIADSQVGNLYFDAISVSPDPIKTGSDELFEVASNSIAGGGGGGIANEDVNFSASAPFAITISGATDENSVQTSPFTIGCIGGTGTYPAIGQATTPQDVNFPNATGVSASPPSSGVTSWRVYAKVNATMTSEGANVNSSGTIVIELQSAESQLVGSNTRYVNNGLGSYTFLFLIGSVDAVRLSNGKYAVKINQVQIGNYSYGNVESTTATAGGSTISTKDGLRTFTICINGEPFTCDIDVSNIVKVT